MSEATPSGDRCRHCATRQANNRRALCNTCYADTAVRAMHPAAAAEPKRTVCRHCDRAKVARPRGLCWKCYYTPGVRDLYPSTSPFARRGVGNITGVQPLPPLSTDTVPGSAERVAVLEERARLKQALWHPADVVLDTAPRLPTLSERPALVHVGHPLSDPKPTDLISSAAWACAIPKGGPDE